MMWLSSAGWWWQRKHLAACNAIPTTSPQPFFAVGNYCFHMSIEWLRGARARAGAGAGAGAGAEFKRMRA